MIQACTPPATQQDCYASLFRRTAGIPLPGRYVDADCEIVDLIPSQARHCLRTPAGRPQPTLPSHSSAHYRRPYRTSLKAKTVLVLIQQSVDTVGSAWLV